MESWEQRVKDAGANLYEEGLKVNSTPSSEEETKCVEFGMGFASF
jgi:flavorubredoxin